MPKKPAHTEAQTRTFWSVFEARMAQANNTEDQHHDEQEEE